MSHTGAVVPEARWALTSAFPHHRYFDVAWSSQAFAVNLFAPLTRGDVAALLAPVFGPVEKAEDPQFEWSDPDDRLGESSSPRPHRTQVDVVLRGKAVDGRRVAVLVEVKYTEPDFSPCSAVDAAPLDAVGPCITPGPFGAHPSQCFQLRNWDQGDGRRYDKFLPALAAASDVVGCWFRSGLNQVMRLVALGAALHATGELDDWRVALCAPAGNWPVQRTWNHAQVLFGDRLLDLLPDTVLEHHPRSTRATLEARYFGRVVDSSDGDDELDPPMSIAAKGAAGLQLAAELLDRRPDLDVSREDYPAGGDVIALADGGGHSVRIVVGGGIHLSDATGGWRSGLWWEIAKGRRSYALDALDRHLGSPAAGVTGRHAATAMCAAADIAAGAPDGRSSQVVQIDATSSGTTIQIGTHVVTADAHGCSVRPTEDA